MSKNKVHKTGTKSERKKEHKNPTTPSKSFYSHLYNFRYPILALIIIVFGFILYFNTLNAPFYFDDYDSIIDNPIIKNIQYFAHYTGIQDMIHTRYFSYLTFAVNYHFSEINVVSYHVVNIAIHLLSSILVMLLTKQILNSTTIKDLYDDNDKFKIAAFATFLFLVHPVQTQAVTYIVQRMTSLAGLFYFASIYFYMLGRNNFYKDPSLRNKLIFIIAFIFSAISFLFGLLSKQIAVTVPITIIICELLLIRNKKMKISWIIVGSISVILLFMGILMLTTIGLPIEADNTPRHVYLLTQIDVMFTYFRLLILPINQNIDYDFPMRYSLIDLEIIFKLFLLIAVVFFSVRMSGKNKLYAFGVLWFFVTISVESSIIPIRDVINEYRLYIPIFGFAVIASVSLLYISKKFFNQKKFLLFSSSLLIILAILSYNRNELWNDPEKMWTDVISKSPKKDRPYLARGSHYLRTNQVDVAISDFQKVLQLNKNEFRAYDNLGYAYQSKNQFDQAIRYHEVAIKMNPRSALSYNNRGVCYINKKEWDKAVTDFSTAISLYNDYTDAFFNLGYVYYFKKEYDNSIKYFTKALNLNPSYYDIYPYLVISYYRLGKLNLARNNYETMKRLEMKIPNSIRAVMEN